MMRKKNALILFLLLGAPLLALSVFAFLQLGDLKWVLVFVLLVPLALLIMTLYLHFSKVGERNQRFFEIERNLTDAERVHYNRLNKFYLKDWVIIILAESLLLFLFLFSPFFGHRYSAFIGPWIFMIVFFPYLWRRQKKVMQFLLSTEYAQSKGWNTL